MWRSLSHAFGVVRLYRTFSIYIVAGETRCAWCLCPSSGCFKHIEPLHYRDSKLWKVLTHEFGVARPYRNFSINIVKGETRCAGCLGTSSGWFKHIEPQRTYSNHSSTELARCGEVCHISSGWFDCTEPSLGTSLQGKQGVQGAYAIGRGGSSTSNRIEPTRTTMRSGWFKHIEPDRTYSNHNITEIARCGEVCHIRSGWFDCTEPSLSTSLQGKQGVQGAYAIVRGGSSTLNLIEPTRTTTSQR